MVKAWVLILSTPGSEPDIAEKLKEFPEVKEIGVVYGEWDVVVKIETDSLKKLDEIVLKIRRDIPGIVRTMTLISVE